MLGAYRGRRCKQISADPQGQQRIHDVGMPLVAHQQPAVASRRVVYEGPACICGPRLGSPGKELIWWQRASR